MAAAHGICGYCTTQNTVRFSESTKPPDTGKGVLQKVDEAVAKVNANVNIPTQSDAVLVAPGKRTIDTQKADAARPPRVMIGSADRIENLWPRN